MSAKKVTTVVFCNSTEMQLNKRVFCVFSLTLFLTDQCRRLSVGLNHSRELRGRTKDVLRGKKEHFKGLCHIRPQRVKGACAERRLTL